MNTRANWIQDGGLAYIGTTFLFRYGSLDLDWSIGVDLTSDPHHASPDRSLVLHPHYISEHILLSKKFNSTYGMERKGVALPFSDSTHRSSLPSRPGPAHFGAV